MSKILFKFYLRGRKPNILNPKNENSVPAVRRVIPVLVLNWDLNEDSISTDLREDELKNGILTKRKTLSLTHRVFDPIRYTSPVTLRPKIMLQCGN